MSELRYNQQETVLDLTQTSERAFVTNVFSFMTLALVISGVMAFWFGTTDLIFNLVKSDGSGMTGMGWAVMFAPLAFILVMNFGFNRLSYPALLMVYLGFSAIMGISLSYIFILYSGASIAKVFLITAGLFGTMAVIGYTTKTDLTKLGSLLMMALIGLIIASVVNFFMKSSTMDYIISCAGVLIFTGLVAYDTQKVKRIGAGVEYGTATASKLAIMGATSLYLDFINLFMFLLRILGRRD
ncbi:MAG: Bax inhibitor-1/YccA family protein [Flavobacteriales bacterium]|nr:Bax inhibitor-1/YccA family protein [Flavobacteriales bacterium]